MDRFIGIILTLLAIVFSFSFVGYLVTPIDTLVNDVCLYVLLLYTVSFIGISFVYLMSYAYVNKEHQ